MHEHDDEYYCFYYDNERYVPERKDHKRVQRERRRAFRYFRRFDNGGVDE